MDTIEYRSASLDDLDAVYEIEYSSSARWTRVIFEKELNTAFSHFIIAKTENAIVGFIIAWNISGDIEIQNLAVHKNFRRRGIASKLIEHVISVLKDYHPHKILLEVRESNHSARAFYKALAFYETGRRKSYYDNEDALLMERKL